MITLAIIQIILAIIGIFMVAFAYTKRVPEHRSASGDKPWSQGGFNPLWPFDLKAHKDWWQGSGFKIHCWGVAIFAIGITSGAIHSIISLISRLG